MNKYESSRSFYDLNNITNHLLNIILLLIIFLSPGISSVYATSSYPQTKIDIDVKDASLVEFFKQIQQNTEFVFFYNDDVLKDNVRISLNLEKASLDKVLQNAFLNTSLVYIISDKQVVVKKLPRILKVTDLKDKQETIIVTGTITGADTGMPIPGANILKKGTTIGTMTDFDGNYSIEVPEDAILQVSYIGFATKEINVNGRSEIDIVLETDLGALDEVVLVGYGKQKKMSVIGAVETIKPEDLRIPSTNLSNSFGGRIAGVISVQPSGEPGADGANFWIRGISTFAAQTSPLIILDGVEVSMADLNALAPEVIENFSVLKDATATAVYGAKGANGVLVVNTKQGKLNSPTKINVRVENRISQPTQVPDFADGVTYMKMYNEAIRTRSKEANPNLKFSQEKIEGTISAKNSYAYPNVNWYEELFTDYAMSQTANLNLSGGSDKITYFISVLANHDKGLFKNFKANSIETAQDNLRYTFQNNLRAYLTDNLEVGLRVNAQIQDYKRPRESTAALFASTISANPVLFPSYYPNTSEDAYRDDYVLFGNSQGGPTQNRFPNPFAQLATGSSEMFASTVIAVFDAEQNLDFITEGLKTSGLASFKNWSTTTTTKYYNPTYYELSEYNPNSTDNKYDLNVIGTEVENSLKDVNSNGGDKMITFQFRMNYDRIFDEVHDVSGMLIYLQRDYSINNPSNFIQTLHERNQGWAGRFTYNYDNRYFIEGNFGYNGSENFAEGKRYGFFPSFAAGYLISNETYFESLKETITNLKIRASYGLVGNSFVNPRFPYVTEVNTNGAGYTFGKQWNNSNSGPVITKFGNPNATWEEAKKFDIGLELGLFNELDIIVDYFREDRSGIFMQRNTLPSFIGIGNAIPSANMGRVLNHGFDASINYNKHVSKDLSLSGKATFTYAKNELLERDEPVYQYDYLSEIGHPLNSYKVLIADGLFKDQSDIDNSARQTYTSDYMPGDIKYKDLNDDGVVDDNDRMIAGDPSVPQIIYGLGFSAQYKAWDASVFFQGIGNVSNMINNIAPFGTLQRNVLGFIAESYWSEANPNINAKHPRLDNGDNANNLQPSTYWLREGGFFRLKNFEVGYTFQKFRTYINGSNILTFSKFDYWDPEIGGGNGLGYPPQKVFNVGIQFNL